IPVVLGGIHPTALPAEAALHADAVVLGEAESVWGQVLQDAGCDGLQQFYQGERLPLAGLPMPLDSHLKQHYRFRAFFTMRGCPYPCKFCSVRKFFGCEIRYRPVAEVAREVALRGGRVWFNGDDNIWAGDPARNLALFEELAQGPRQHWFGFGDLKTVQQPMGEQLLRAARRSGLFSLMVGWESDSEEALRDFGALGKQGQNRIEAIRRMQSHGIYVVLFVVLGGKHDSPDSFQRTLELSERLNVGVHPILLMPLPGTELFEEYRERLLPDRGWQHYSGLRAVFDHEHPSLTPERIEEEYHKLRVQLFKPGAILKRIAAIPKAGFPDAHFLSLMKELPMSRNMKRAYRDWQAKYGSDLEDKA
ncbi:MAG TPA: radical SAM protein, partial [Bacillota bacterium]|nr:radical SAM protein [Bacillota bacterium]